MSIEEIEQALAEGKELKFLSANQEILYIISKKAGEECPYWIEISNEQSLVYQEQYMELAHLLKWEPIDITKFEIAA